MSGSGSHWPTYTSRLARAERGIEQPAARTDPVAGEEHVRDVLAARRWATGQAALAGQWQGARAEHVRQKAAIDNVLAPAGLTAIEQTFERRALRAGLTRHA